MASSTLNKPDEPSLVAERRGNWNVISSAIAVVGFVAIVAAAVKQPTPVMALVLDNGWTILAWLIAAFIFQRAAARQMSAATAVAIALGLGAAKGPLWTIAALASWLILQMEQRIRA